MVMKLTQRLWMGLRGLTYQSLLARGPAASSEVEGSAQVPLGAASAGLGSPAAWAGTPLYWTLRTLLTLLGLHPSPLLPISEVSLCWARMPIWDPQTLAEGTGSSVHWTGNASLGDVHLVTSTPAPSWPRSSPVITASASSIFVCHTSKGHTLARRQAGRQAGSTPLPTWAQHRQGYPYSTAEQRVQHKHPVWADLEPAENLLHLGGRTAR